MAEVETKERVWLPGSDISEADKLLEQFDLKGSGFPRDKLNSDPKKFVSNFRRILPQHQNMQSFAVVMAAHYVGPKSQGRPVGCLRLMGISSDCPLCNYGFELNSSGDKKGAQDILPTTSAYINVVKLTQDGELAEDKIFVLRLNKNQFTSLKDEFDNRGDLTHIETGRNINFRAKEVKQGTLVFNELKFGVSESCPFPGDLDLLDGMYNLTEVIPFYEPAEMIDLLTGKSTAVVASGPDAFALPEGSTTKGPLEPELVTDPDEPQIAAKPGAFVPDDEEEETPADDPADDLVPTKASARQGKAPVSSNNEAIERLQKRMQNGA